MAEGRKSFMNPQKHQEPPRGGPLVLKEPPRFEKAIVYYFRGLAREDLNLFSKAEVLLQEELSLEESSQDSNDAKVATCLHCLANALYHQGKLKEAEAAYKRATNLYENLLDSSLKHSKLAKGRKHGKCLLRRQSVRRELAIAYSNLARVYLSKGMRAETESAMWKAWRLSDEVFCPGAGRL